jgi:hypothetical protein
MTCHKFCSVTQTDLQGWSHLCYALSDGLLQDESITRRRGCARQSLPLVMPPTRALPNLKILPHNIWMDQIQPNWKIPWKTKDPSPKWKNPPSKSRILFYNLPHLKQKKVWAGLSHVGRLS